MSYPLGLAIAGRDFRFSFDSSTFGSAMARRYSAFRRRTASPGLRIKSGGAAGPPFTPRVSGTGVLTGRRGDFEFTFGPGRGRGIAEISPRAQSFDSFLRALTASLLNMSGGALVHSCGLIAGGKAHVFIGRSGAGKSTLAKLASAAGAEIISDEIVPLRRERGRIFAYGSPFWGEMRSAGRPLRLPVAGIYTLRKSGRSSLCPGPACGFVPVFLRCCLSFSKEPSAAASMLGTAAAASSIYRGELSFSRKDASFLALLK